MVGSSGFPFVLLAAMLTALTFALALRLRSWPLWLLAFLLSVGTFGLAWYLRAPLAVTPAGLSAA